MEPQSILDDLHLLDLKEEIRCLVLHARREVESRLGGAYAARRRGTGVEFEELREFVDGDDARFIHWPSTLTQGRPFVKRYREEHQLDMLICMDVSKSMRVMQTVMQTALEIAALMGGCACYVGDAVGLLLRSTATEGWLPPCRGERQLLRILREIAGCRLSDGGTDLDGMLTATANVLKRHSRVVVISDWLGDSSGNELRYLAYRHEVANLLQQLESLRITVYEKRIRVSYPFAEGWQDGVSALLKTALDAFLEAQEEGEDLIFGAPAPNGNFSVSEEGVTWIYNPYEIAPYAMGSVELSVRWSDLKPYLK